MWKKCILLPGCNAVTAPSTWPPLNQDRHDPRPGGTGHERGDMLEIVVDGSLGRCDGLDAFGLAFSDEHQRYTWQCALSE